MLTTVRRAVLLIVYQISDRRYRSYRCPRPTGFSVASTGSRRRDTSRPVLAVRPRHAVGRTEAPRT